MRDDTIHEEVYKGHLIKIELDDYDESPKSWDRTGTLVTWHSRYEFDENGKDYGEPCDFLFNLSGMEGMLLKRGEVHTHINYFEDLSGFLYDINGGDLARAETRAREIVESQAWQNSVRIAVGMGDHSGIWLYEGHRAAAFDPGGWDSGGIGWLYVRKDRILEEYNYDRKFQVKTITPKVREYALMRLRAELQTWDDYVRGNVYGYVIEKDDGKTDSCWGFYPDHDDSKGYEPDYTYCLEEARSAVDSEVEYEKKEHFEQLKTWIRARVPYYARKGMQIYG